MESSLATPRGTRPSVTLPVFMFGHFSHHLCTAALVPLLPMIRDSFQLDYLQSGMLMSALGLTYGFMQLPTAVLADRVSKRRLLSLGLLGTGAACLGVGLSTDYSQLLLALVLMGATGSTYHAPASAFLSQTFARSRLGRSYGLHLVGGTAGFMLAPIVSLLVANTTGSWRNAFLVMGLPILLCAVLFWIVLRTQETANIKAVAGDREKSLRPTQVVRLLGPLVIIAILTRLLSSAMNSFLPLYLVDKHGAPREVAGLIMSVVYGSELVGAPLGGTLSDRFGRKPVLLFSVLMMGPLMALVTTLPLGPWMAGSIIAYGVFVIFRSPALESFIADTIPARQRATVLGAYHFIAQEMAGITTPAFGFILDRFGPTDGFSFLAAFALGCSLLVIVIWKKL